MSVMYTYRLKSKLRRFSMSCLSRAHLHVRRVGLSATNKPNLGINQTFASIMFSKHVLSAPETPIGKCGHLTRSCTHGSVQSRK